MYTLTFNILYGYFAEVASQVAYDNQDLDQWAATCCHGNRGAVPAPAVHEKL